MLYTFNLLQVEKKLKGNSFENLYYIKQDVYANNGLVIP